MVLGKFLMPNLRVFTGLFSRYLLWDRQPLSKRTELHNSAMCHAIPVQNAPPKFKIARPLKVTFRPNSKKDRLNQPVFQSHHFSGFFLAVQLQACRGDLCFPSAGSWAFKISWWVSFSTQVSCMPPCASKFMDPECHKCTLGKFEPLKLRVGVGWGLGCQRTVVLLFSISGKV